MYRKAQLCGPWGVREGSSQPREGNSFVGEGTMSNEGSSNVDYLWRAPSTVSFPRPTSHKVGEVGWGLSTFSDWSAANTGQQIQLGEFRQLVEDRCTHLYQNAWYPGPKEEFPPDSDAAQVMNVYKSSGSRSGSRPSTTRQTRHEQKNRPASAYSSYSEHSNGNNNNNNNNNNGSQHEQSQHKYNSYSGTY